MGLIFVGPLLVPDYPAALQSTGRYLAFGLITLPLAWFDRRRLRKLRRRDWLEALKLTAIGNLLYYLCTASAIQRTGAPVSTMIIGTLPVVIALCANLFTAGTTGGWLGQAGAGAAADRLRVSVRERRRAARQRAADRWLALSQRPGLAVLAVACWTGSRCATRAGCGRTRRSGRPRATAQGGDAAVGAAGLSGGLRPIGAERTGVRLAVRPAP